VFAAARSNRPRARNATTTAAATHPANASAARGEGAAATISNERATARPATAPVVAPIEPVSVNAAAALAPSVLPASVTFELASDPSGVPVWIDGKPFPNADQQVSTWAHGDLPTGTHKIELTKPGYRPWRRTVEIKAGRPNRFLARLQKDDPAEIFAQLKPAVAGPEPSSGHLPAVEGDRGQAPPPGGPGPCSMTVGSVPWTDLWVDGTNTHRHTPVPSFLAPCGPHRVELRRSDLHIHLTTEVDLVPGRNAKLIYHFDGAGQVVGDPR
jgi:hypothetical protein